MRNRFISILENEARQAEITSKKCDSLKLREANTIMSKSYEACIATIREVDFGNMGSILASECDQREPSIERNAYQNALVLYNDFAQGPEILRTQMEREAQS